MNIRRRNFALLVALAAAAVAPGSGQSAPAGTAIPDFGGVWDHPGLPGFEPLASGPTSLVNLARRDLKPECGWRLGREIDKGQLLLNLRAETAPKTLQDVLTASLAGDAAAADGPRITLERFECFRPSPPVPTHRIELNINSVDSPP